LTHDPVHLKSRLTAAIRGDVLSPGDQGYDEARAVWNARFDRRPDLIARCLDAGDVSSAIQFAREQNLPLSVKGGGHDYAGNTVAEGGLLIDLGPMKAVEVDVPGRRVTVGAGCTWRDVDEATQPHGLATTAGTVSTVGVSGFTLGGGLGWLARKHGLAADNLLGADVVTASGEVVRADETHNPDLFWAIRGGSGNFGVVTSFELALHEVGPDVLAGQVIYPAERAPELLRFFRDRFRDAPDELMCFPFFLRIPPLELFPEEVHGKLVLDFVLFYAGSVEEGENALAPFRELGDPIMDAVFPQPYLTLQQSFDAGMAKGNRWFSRSHHLDALTDEAIDDLIGHLDPFPGEFTAVYFGPGGGAVGRAAPDATAYPHRASAFELHIFPGWLAASRDEEIMDWAQRLFDVMTPHANGGVYVNLLGDGEEDRVGAAYRDNFGRLRELKAKWDPENLFRNNHNIPPAG
jgi:FAD/FMN-containing dehydrogenase